MADASAASTKKRPGRASSSAEEEDPESSALLGEGAVGRVPRGRTTTLQWAMMTSFQCAYAYINTTMGIFILPEEATRLNDEYQSVWVGFYLMLAGVTQLIGPVAGLLCDRHQSKYGKRRPIVASGTLFAILFFGIMWLASTKKLANVFMFSLVGCQFSLNVVFAAQCGLPADIHEEDDERGVSNDGAKGLVSSFIAVHGLIGALLAMVSVVVTKNQPVQVLYPTFMVFLALTATLIVSSVRETPTDQDAPKAPITLAEVGKSFTINLERDIDFFWVCAGRAAYYVSTSISVFLYYYIRDMLHIGDEALRRQELGLLAVCVNVMGAISAVPWGNASNRYGRKPIIYLSCCIMGVAFILFAVAPKLHSGNMAVATAAGAVYGLASGAYLSVDYALALDCMPVEKTKAEAFGLWGVAGFIGTSVGPLISGLLLCIGQAGFAYHAGTAKSMQAATSAAFHSNHYEYPGYFCMMIVNGLGMSVLVMLATKQISRDV